MNILIIGNGFDLAHGLPTKYTDFLVFCKMILTFIEVIKIDNWEIKIGTCYKNWLTDRKFEINTKLYRNWIEKIKENLEKVLKSDNDKKVYKKLIDHCIWIVFLQEKLCGEILYMIENNYWVEYFLNNPLYQKENWIDFENEISKVIHSLDDDMKGLDDDMKSLNDLVSKLSNKYLSEKYFNHINIVQPLNLDIIDTESFQGITYKQIRDKLLSDLRKFIRLFEIYLCKYVQSIKINKISPDIESIVYSKGGYFDLDKKHINKTYTKVLSFNYTNIYNRMYLDTCRKGLNEVVDYIHGKADINNTIENNNMVLGIDEYLPEDRKNKEIEFIAFKKYYQRIHKGTGCKYKEWLDEIIRENDEYEDCFFQPKSSFRVNTKGVNKKGININSPRHNLYIFGHSLDITDKDILRELILTDYVYTTIYYRNLDQKGQQIANLVKVIGQDELIQRTGGGSARSIEFKLQQPMKNKK